MRAVIQRVSSAAVHAGGAITGEIDRGLVVLLGAAHSDTDADATLLARKIADLRIFSDAAGKFNLSLLDTGGAALVVSQFTLFADTRKGRRPSFTAAAPPEQASQLVDQFVAALGALGVPVATGVFGAHMEVTLVNDGPVTITLDTMVWTARR